MYQGFQGKWIRWNCQIVKFSLDGKQKWKKLNGSNENQFKDKGQAHFGRFYLSLVFNSVCRCNIRYW